MPLVKGYCRARLIRWFYDNEANKCESFLYSGCGGNENNFGTVDECSKKCEIVGE